MIYLKGTNFLRWKSCNKIEHRGYKTKGDQTKDKAPRKPNTSYKTEHLHQKRSKMVKDCWSQFPVECVAEQTAPSMQQHHHQAEHLTSLPINKPSTPTMGSVKESAPNPWGDFFKSRENFIEMHIC